MLLLVWRRYGAAIIVEKVGSVRHERRHSTMFEDAFWSGGWPMRCMTRSRRPARRDDPRVRRRHAGMAARQRGLASAARSDPRASLLGRVERSMTFTITREMERLEKGMNFLASIGSVSPSSACSAPSGGS